MRDPIEQFKYAMQQRGLIAPAGLIADGKIHRCDVDSKNGKGDGAYLLHLDGYPLGGFQNWQDGRPWEQWRADQGRALSAEEEQSLWDRLSVLRQQREQVQEQERKEARVQAESIWKAAPPAPDDHPYLVRKHVHSHGLRLYQGRLVVPVHDSNREIHSLQFIDAEGDKRFLPGGRVAGCYMSIGDPKCGVVCIAEGYATAATVHEATGFAVAVAFNATNLEKVARELKVKFPDQRKVIAADNDHATEGNPGLRCAQEAAAVMNEIVVAPTFESGQGTDWNDYAAIHGVERVQRTFQEALASQAGAKQGSGDGEDFQATVTRLAKLSPLEYDRVRDVQAKGLGCRLSTLDEAVQRERSRAEPKRNGRPLEIPEVKPWPEPVDGAALLAEIAELFRAHIKLPESADIVLALWTVFTYVYDAFNICPMLIVTSPEKGCGKSTVLSLLGKLVNRPLPSSNITAAALFRVVEAAAPTLLIDEGDSFAKNNEELRGILNSGHTRDLAQVIRTNGDDHEPAVYRTWAPKALAAIGRLPDTVEDRAIVLTLQRKRPGDQVRRLRVDQEFGALRQRCARWAQDCRRACADARVDGGGFLANRAADNWEPLLAIAQVVGGDWPERVMGAARHQSERSDADSIGVKLLRDIRAAFTAKQAERLPTRDLVAELCRDEESPWREFQNGKELSAPQLARLLGRYGIKPKATRIGGPPVKGYELAQFEEAFARYLPSESSDAGGNAVTNHE